MFARIHAAVFYMTVVLTLLAAATPLEGRGGSPPTHPTKTVTVTPGPTATVSPGQCNTGPIQCCSSVQSASSPSSKVLLGLLGIVVSDVTALIGLGCSPITVIGVGGSSCSAHPVCCQNNAVGSLISIGCIPVSL